MPVTQITPLDRTSPTFRADVDTLFETQLPLLTSEMNVVLAQLDGAEASEAAAAASASAAAAAAETASYAAGVSQWVSGTTYVVGQTVWSPVNLQTYRRRVAGAGTTDPSLDSTNWRGLNGQANFDAIPVAASDINLSLGNYFTKTNSGSWSPTFSNVPSGGASFSLEVQMDGGSIALPASVKVVNDFMPTLTTGKTHLLMFSTKNGGARWRLAILPNFVN